MGFLKTRTNIISRNMLAQIETLKQLEWTREKMLSESRNYHAQKKKEKEFRRQEKDKMQGEKIQTA